MEELRKRRLQEAKVFNRNQGYFTILLWAAFVWGIYSENPELSGITCFSGIMLTVLYFRLKSEIKYRLELEEKGEEVQDIS